MQAILLAAGMGRRMKKYTKNHTKCMIEVGGRTLLERVVEALEDAGIRKLIIVMGYEAELLKEYVESKNFPLEIEYVYNYDYATTNNIYSLFLAKDHLAADDTILMESDLIFEKSILKQVVMHEEENIVVAAKYEQWMDGTMVLLDKQRNIIEFVDKSQFRYEDVDRYYKTVNIYKFSKEFSEKQYIPFMEAYLKAYGTNQYYEQVLKIVAHIKNSELKAFLLSDENWYEVDDAQDLDIADTMFSDPEGALNKYERHYGGYWRFPKMKDYCYLVNPYYPPPKLLNQMKYFFEILCSQYPSGMGIQKLNAGSMFDLDEDYILVGNGAAELINVLGKILKGRVSVGIPAFNEYIRCFKNCELRFMDNAQEEYGFSVNKIMDEIEETDNLMLINPDNPSGAFLKVEEIINILDRCKEKGVVCIIDESFIDFADADLRYTLLDEDILDQYPQLVVIKSISKSYGVPGLRLGIMATANQEIKELMLENMAIWNINSFAEYYLQIQRLYKNSYILSCNKIANQRSIMMEQLEKINCLRVFPSQANYIMCEVKGEVSSSSLAADLLKNWNILIKDLSTKKGFSGKSFIRIAVKNEEDNQLLLQAMQEILEHKSR